MLFAPELAPRIRYAVREVNAFVAHRFDKSDRAVVDRLTAWLEKIGFRIVTGEGGEPATISDKVIRRIEECELFVGIFTRVGQSENGKYQTASWLIEEKQHAINAGKPLMLFVEEGVDIGGMHADHEYIPFTRDDLAGAYVKAFEYLLELSGIRLTISSNGPGNIHLRFEGEYLTPQAQLSRIDALIKRSPANYDLVGRRADLLLQVGDRPEAERLLEDAVKSNPRAYDLVMRLATIKYEDKHYSEAIELYEKALMLRPGSCKSYCQYGRCLVAEGRGLRDHTERAAKLKEAKQLICQAIELAEKSKCSGLDSARQNLNLAEMGLDDANSKMKKVRRKPRTRSGR